LASNVHRHVYKVGEKLVAQALLEFTKQENIRRQFEVRELECVQGTMEESQTRLKHIRLHGVELNDAFIQSSLYNL